MQLESKTVSYRQGHFYDVETNKRIEIENESELCVVAITGSFREAAPIGKITDTPKSDAQMLKEIQLLSGLKSYELFASAGTELYFALDDRKHQFKAVLLEDLYVYSCVDWKNSNDIRFYDCYCRVEENTNGSISHFEPVYGTSINDLYKTAYVHYLQNNGHSARNAAKVYHWDIGLTNKIEGRKKEIKRRHF